MPTKRKPAKPTKKIVNHTSHYVVFDDTRWGSIPGVDLKVGQSATLAGAKVLAQKLCHTKKYTKEAAAFGSKLTWSKVKNTWLSNGPFVIRQVF